MKKLLIILIMPLIVISCGIFNKKPVLTEQKMINYLKAHKEFKRVRGGFSGITGNAMIDKKISDFPVIEKIVLESGFKNYEEFCEVQRTVSIAYGLLHSDLISDQISKFKETEELTESDIKEYNKMLDDPAVSKNRKNQIKMILEENKKIIEENRLACEKNRELTKKIMETSKNLINPADLELTAKYKDDIMEAYTGIKKK